MEVGAIDSAEWAELDAERKRRRLLDAAAQVFAAQGVDAPMPSIAAAAGAGIGSVYRQFPSKQDLLAALVIERTGDMIRTGEQALAEGGRAASILAVCTTLVERQAVDDVYAEALTLTSEHPEVNEHRTRALELLDALLVRSKERGEVRADATELDVRLLFLATRTAGRLGRPARDRMLALMLEALRPGGEPG